MKIQANTRSELKNVQSCQKLYMLTGTEDRAISTFHFLSNAKKQTGLTL